MMRALVWSRPKLVAALALANIAAAAYFVPKWMAGYYLDLEVYRIGARTWLAGGDLYGTLPATSVGLALPFTYPPVAAALFAPLTWMSPPVAGALLTALGLVALATVLRLPRAAVLAAVLPVAALLEPVRETLNYGQINLLLMALVTLDCLTRTPRWPRGALVGLAAAIKLTPAGFVLFFLLRKDFRAAGTAVATCLITTAAGFLLAGRDSVRYWTETSHDTGRIGTVHYAGNQSLLAVLARLGLQPPLRTLSWLAGTLMILTVAVVAIRRARTSAHALSLNALTILAISPISWSHHWVWIVLVLPVLPRIWAGTGLAIFVAAPQWWWPATENREPEWNLLQQALGNAYFWFASAVLLLAMTGGAEDAPEVGFVAGGPGTGVRVGRPGTGVRVGRRCLD